MIVEDKNQRRRLRLLIGRLNKERKKRAKQIDMLCNDFITAQKDFIKRLNAITFAANFYESIIGTTELGGLLQAAIRLIRGEIGEANVIFFLREGNNFELHIFEGERPSGLEKRQLENYFSAELMDNICNSNRMCTLEDMLGMGLEGNPAALSRISAVTIPLGLVGASLGFILIYRSSADKLTADELSNISAITCGLSQAIQACQKLLQAAH
jgi:transcriptional regulator with GAF, ATPase, and Fis domain